MSDYRKRVSKMLHKVPVYDDGTKWERDEGESLERSEDDSLKGDLDTSDIRRMVFLVVMILLIMMFGVWLNLEIASWAAPSR